MKRIALLGLCLLLSACAARTPLPLTAPTFGAPLPAALRVERQQGADQQTWWLVVQAEQAALRWSLFDPLGMPLARQLLEDGKWRADGLLPPNSEAQELFAALLFALTPIDKLPASYAPEAWQQLADGQRRLNPHWLIDYRAPLDFTLSQGQVLSYRVYALADDEIP
ncbi:hypothetical protein [Pseudomonas sp.]|uniref:hypothetical protein n=1 Tax=Pseudomonas sp. TaxID=306 RepID=UPI002C963582|nr:hypothetical protein [Pseudomonas sp.]HUE91981.1 hypothetical protein [Pseudomonas sp.]